MALVKRSTLLGAVAMALAVLSGGGASKSAPLDPGQGKWQVTVSSATKGEELDWDGREMKLRPVNRIDPPTVQDSNATAFRSATSYVKGSAPAGHLCSSNLTHTFTVQLDWVEAFAGQKLVLPADDVRMKINGRANIGAAPAVGTPQAETVGIQPTVISTPAPPGPSTTVLALDKGGILVFSRPAQRVRPLHFQGLGQREGSPANRIQRVQ